MVVTSATTKHLSLKRYIIIRYRAAVIRGRVSHTPSVDRTHNLTMAPDLTHPFSPHTSSMGHVFLIITQTIGMLIHNEVMKYLLSDH